MSSDTSPEEKDGQSEPAENPPLQYEANPKHKDPWQRGRKGSLCEQELHLLAEGLLADSVLVGEKRYAVYNEKAYCAQEHAPDRWHGYPVGWQEVPAKLTREWIKKGLLSKKAKKKYWESH